jgi:hypothetical protein
MWCRRGEGEMMVENDGLKSYIQSKMPRRQRRHVYRGICLKVSKVAIEVADVDVFVKGCRVDNEVQLRTLIRRQGKIAARDVRKASL